MRFKIGDQNMSLSPGLLVRWIISNKLKLTTVEKVEVIERVDLKNRISLPHDNRNGMYEM